MTYKILQKTETILIKKPGRKLSYRLHVPRNCRYTFYFDKLYCVLSIMGPNISLAKYLSIPGAYLQVHFQMIGLLNRSM